MIGVVVVLGVSAAVAVLVYALRFVHSVSPASPPYDPADASWRYGKHLMETKVYATLADDDVGGACRRASSCDRHAPKHLVLGRAIDGCRYAEWLFDN